MIPFIWIVLDRDPRKKHWTLSCHGFFLLLSLLDRVARGVIYLALGLGAKEYEILDIYSRRTLRFCLRGLGGKVATEP